MTDYVVIVPKQDEFMAVEWGFKTDFSTPGERTRMGVELHRRSLPIGDVTFALLDKQTNTWSSILTAAVLAKEDPRLVFLVGTALGQPNKVALGSVVASDGVFDISEKRYTDNGHGRYVTHGPIKADEVTLDVKNFIWRHFPQRKLEQTLRSMARNPQLLKGGPKKLNQFITDHQPAVRCEPVVSGNEYRMTAADLSPNEIWDHVTTARAYDMEAAGFALAAESYGVQWLVVRGISDYGTSETKSDYHRALAAGAASRFLYEFLETGLVRAAARTRDQESTATISLLRDEAYRLDGSWHGIMAYLDDSNDPVVFEERAEFEQTGLDVTGLVRSHKLRGTPRHDDLEYKTIFMIAKHGYAGGIWSETLATRQYFGVMLGEFENDSRVLGGTWLGTHRGGVRLGLFRWYNTIRDGSKSQMAFDLETAADELLAELRGGEPQTS